MKEQRKADKLGLQGKKDKMAISKIQKISKKELTRIEKVIGESFVTNDLYATNIKNKKLDAFY